MQINRTWAFDIASIYIILDIGIMRSPKRCKNNMLYLLMITIMTTITITIKGKDKDNDKNTSELKKWVYIIAPHQSRSRCREYTTALILCRH